MLVSTFHLDNHKTFLKIFKSPNIVKASLLKLVRVSYLKYTDIKKKNESK